MPELSHETAVMIKRVTQLLHSQADAKEKEGNDFLAEKKKEALRLRELATALIGEFPVADRYLSTPPESQAQEGGGRTRGFFNSEAVRFIRAQGPTKLKDLLKHLRDVYGDEVTEEMVKGFCKRQNNDPKAPVKRVPGELGLYYVPFPETQE
jgi:hypothetical protein